MFTVNDQAGPDGDLLLLNALELEVARNNSQLFRIEKAICDFNSCVIPCSDYVFRARIYPSPSDSSMRILQIDLLTAYKGAIAVRKAFMKEYVAGNWQKALSELVSKHVMKEFSRNLVSSLPPSSWGKCPNSETTVGQASEGVEISSVSVEGDETRSAHVRAINWEHEEEEPVASVISRPLIGVALSVPQVISGSLGVIIGKSKKIGVVPHRYEKAYGLLLQIEPGLGGGKASVGAAWMEEIRPFELDATAIEVAGLWVKLSLLRTWGYPVRFGLEDVDHTPFPALETGQTLIGGEVGLAFAAKFTIGYLYSLDSNDGFLTGGVGLGF
ncbi:MAG: hypothetical protein AB1540_17095 [Bdellovibrionota bacterium]